MSEVASETLRRSSKSWTCKKEKKGKHRKRKESKKERRLSFVEGKEKEEPFMSTLLISNYLLQKKEKTKKKVK